MTHITSVIYSSRWSVYHHHLMLLFIYYHPFHLCLFMYSWAGMLGEDHMHRILDGDNWCCRGGFADCMSSAKWLGPMQFNRSELEGDVLWQVCKFSKVRGKRAWQDNSTPLLLLPSKFFKKATRFLDTEWIWIHEETYLIILIPYSFTLNKVNIC